MVLSDNEIVTTTIKSGLLDAVAPGCEASDPIKIGGSDGVLVAVGHDRCEFGEGRFGVELNRSNFVDGPEIATVVLEIVEYGGGLESIFGPFDNPLKYNRVSICRYMEAPKILLGIQNGFQKAK